MIRHYTCSERVFAHSQSRHRRCGRNGRRLDGLPGGLQPRPSESNRPRHERDADPRCGRDPISPGRPGGRPQHRDHRQGRQHNLKPLAPGMDPAAGDIPSSSAGECHSDLVPLNLLTVGRGWPSSPPEHITARATSSAHASHHMSWLGTIVMHIDMAVWSSNLPPPRWDPSAARQISAPKCTRHAHSRKPAIQRQMRSLAKKTSATPRLGCPL